MRLKELSKASDRPAHPEVLKTLEEFNGYLKQLDDPNFISNDETLRKIYRTAVTCEDLMNYSYEFADVTHPKWIELDKVVGKVMNRTNRWSPL